MEKAMIKLIEPGLGIFEKYGGLIHISIVWDKGKKTTYINGNRILEGESHD